MKNKLIAITILFILGLAVVGTISAKGDQKRPPFQYIPSGTELFVYCDDGAKPVNNGHHNNAVWVSCP